MLVQQLQTAEQAWSNVMHASNEEQQLHMAMVADLERRVAVNLARLTLLQQGLEGRGGGGRKRVRWSEAVPSELAGGQGGGGQGGGGQGLGLQRQLHERNEAEMTRLLALGEELLGGAGGEGGQGEPGAAGAWEPWADMPPETQGIDTKLRTDLQAQGRVDWLRASLWRAAGFGEGGGGGAGGGGGGRGEEGPGLQLARGFTLPCYRRGRATPPPSPAQMGHASSLTQHSLQAALQQPQQLSCLAAGLCGQQDSITLVRVGRALEARGCMPRRARLAAACRGSRSSGTRVHAAELPLARAAGARLAVLAA